MKLTFRTRKTGLMADPQSKKSVESRVQNVKGCTARIVARFRAHLSNGHMMEYVWQNTHTDASKRIKQKDQCQTMGRLDSSVTFRHNGQQSSERLHKNKNKQEQRFNMGQIHEVRLAAGEKSLRKAPPRIHCCQPCRQSRSRCVLSTIDNLIWVVKGCCGCAPDVSWSA